MRPAGFYPTIPWRYDVLPPVTKNIQRRYYTINTGECQANDWNIHKNMIKSEDWRKSIVSPQKLSRRKQRKGIFKRLWKSHEKSNKKPQNQANMWSTEHGRFCEKYIEKQPKTSQNSLFSAVFWSKWQDSNLRSHRPEQIQHRFLTTFVDFLVLFSPKTMLSDALVRTVST